MVFLINHNIFICMATLTRWEWLFFLPCFPIPVLRTNWGAVFVIAARVSCRCFPTEHRPGNHCSCLPLCHTKVLVVPVRERFSFLPAFGNEIGREVAMFAFLYDPKYVLCCQIHITPIRQTGAQRNHLCSCQLYPFCELADVVEVIADLGMILINIPDWSAADFSVWILIRILSPSGIRKISR